MSKLPVVSATVDSAIAYAEFQLPNFSGRTGRRMLDLAQLRAPNWKPWLIVAAVRPIWECFFLLTFATMPKQEQEAVRKLLKATRSFQSEIEALPFPAVLKLRQRSRLGKLNLKTNQVDEADEQDLFWLKRVPPFCFNTGSRREDYPAGLGPSYSMRMQLSLLTDACEILLDSDFDNSRRKGFAVALAHRLGRTLLEFAPATPVGRVREFVLLGLHALENEQLSYSAPTSKKTAKRYLASSNRPTSTAGTQISRRQKAYKMYADWVVTTGQPGLILPS